MVQLKKRLEDIGMGTKYKLLPEDIAAIEKVLSDGKDVEIQARKDGTIIILEIERALVARE